jgi:hypothetical protein
VGVDVTFNETDEIAVSETIEMARTASASSADTSNELSCPLKTSC